MVQRASAEVWERDAQFRDAVWAEIEGRGRVGREEFDALFELRPFVERLDGVFARLEKLDVADVTDVADAADGGEG